MDKQVLEQKLESLRCCVQRVETKIPEDVAIVRSSRYRLTSPAQVDRLSPCYEF